MSLRKNRRPRGLDRRYSDSKKKLLDLDRRPHRKRSPASGREYELLAVELIEQVRDGCMNIEIESFPSQVISATDVVCHKPRLGVNAVYLGVLGRQSFLFCYDTSVVVEIVSFSEILPAESGVRSERTDRIERLMYI